MSVPPVLRRVAELELLAFRVSKAVLTIYATGWRPDRLHLFAAASGWGPWMPSIIVLSGSLLFLIICVLPRLVAVVGTLRQANLVTVGVRAAITGAHLIEPLDIFLTIFTGGVIALFITIGIPV